jgi:hypothetical protein
MDAALQPLMDACHAAELTVCALIRVGREQNAPGWAVNVFSVLRYKADPLPGGARAPRYLTERPESSPDGNHKLFVVQTDLSLTEASGLCSFSGFFVDPRAPPEFGGIASPGAWVGPLFVERYEETVRACLPPTERSIWLKERWQPRGELQKEIGPNAVAWVQARVKSVLGVSLAVRRERLGNFLVVLPEERVRMRTQPSQTKDLIGVDIQYDPSGPKEVLIVARGSRDRRAVSAAARKVGPGLHVLPMQSSIDYREIELYDAETGLILDRDAGVPFRDIGIGLNLVTTRLDVRANFVRPDGTPDGEPVHVQTDWGVGHPMRVGSRPEWEEILDEVRAEEQREALRMAGQFFVYRGEAGDRQRAVEDIRGLLHTEVSDFVKVWDPYFGHRDAFEFLFYVAEPTTPIKVLTSMDSGEDEKAGYRASKQAAGEAGTTPLADWKRQQIARVLKTLREPRQGAPGLTELEIRAGGAAFHDRFIITSGRCWQLGCSFNQIGNVMSTIVQFPYPAMIEREFDQAWKLAKAI